MRDQNIRSALDQHWAASDADDFDTEHSIYHEDAVLLTEIESKGATVFAVIDHAGEAARVGLTMPPTKLLIFGSPNAGTPLMLAAPSLAIDLPLKILVSEDTGGSVWMAYNTAEYLADRHGLPRGRSAPLAAADLLTVALAQS